MSLLSEVPVQEDTLMRLLVMGLSKELPLTSSESLDLADKLVKRAAVLYAEGKDWLLHTLSCQENNCDFSVCS